MNDTKLIPLSLMSGVALSVLSVAGSAEAEREIEESTGLTGTAELATATVAIDE